MIGRKRRRREKEAAIQLRRSCILIFISVIPAKRESRDFSDLHWVPPFAGTTNLPGSQVFLTAARKRGSRACPWLEQGAAGIERAAVSPATATPGMVIVDPRSITCCSVRDAGMRSGGLTSALRLRVCGGGFGRFGGDLLAQSRHEQLDDLAVFR